MKRGKNGANYIKITNSLFEKIILIFLIRRLGHTVKEEKAK